MEQQDDEFFECGDTEYLEEIPRIDEKNQSHKIDRSINLKQQTSWNSFNDRMSSGDENELNRQQQSDMISSDLVKDSQDLNLRDSNFNPFLIINQDIYENNAQLGRSNGLSQKKETHYFNSSREGIRNSHISNLNDSNFLRKLNDKSNTNKSMKYPSQQYVSTPQIQPLRVLKEELKIRQKLPNVKELTEKDANVVKKPVRSKSKTSVLKPSVSVPKLTQNAKLQNIPFKPKKSAGEQQQNYNELQKRQFSATPQNIGFFISPSKPKPVEYLQPITSPNIINRQVNSENQQAIYQENGLKSVKNSLRSSPVKAKKKSKEVVQKKSQLLPRQKPEWDSSQDVPNYFQNPSFPIIEDGQDLAEEQDNDDDGGFGESQFPSIQEQQQDRYSMNDIYQMSERDSQYVISSQMISGTDDVEKEHYEIGQNNQLSSSSGFSDSPFETGIPRAFEEEQDRINFEDFYDERTIPSRKSFLNSESGYKYSSSSRMTSVSIEQDEQSECSRNDDDVEDPPQQITNYNHKGNGFYKQRIESSQPVQNIIKQHMKKEHSQLGQKSQGRLSKNPSKKDITLNAEESPRQRRHTPRNKSEERQQADMKSYIKILEKKLEGKRAIINHLKNENKSLKSKQAPVINGQTALHSIARRLQETNKILIDKIKEQDRQKSIQAEQLNHKSAELKLLKQKYSETKKKLKQKARNNSDISKENLFLKGLLPQMMQQQKEVQLEDAMVQQQQQNIQNQMSFANEKPNTPTNATPTSLNTYTTSTSTPASMTTKAINRQSKQSVNDIFQTNFLSPSSQKSIPNKINKKKTKTNSSTQHTSEK